MRKLFLVIFAVIAVGATASACALEGSSTVEGTLTLNSSLGFGGSDDGIIVELLAVEDDSRCPAGAQCIRAGEAFVVLRTTVDDGTPQEHRIEVAPGGTAEIEVDRFTITVLALRPDPPPQGGVEQTGYDIDIRIED